MAAPERLRHHQRPAPRHAPADDEAVRILRFARQWVDDHSATAIAIDAYLAKVSELA